VAGTGQKGSTGDGGPATAATLSNPTGLALDTAGNLYIAEGFGYRVRKLSPDGVIATVVGTGQQGSTGDGGPATSATLNGPTGLAFDIAGDLYITEDCANSACGRVRKVSRSGTISTVG
jgi:secreted PhoX family phosphatase